MVSRHEDHPHPPLRGDLPPQGGGGWRGAGVSTTLPLRGRVGAKLRGGVIRPGRFIYEQSKRQMTERHPNVRPSG